jgi:hypothetical protein
MEKTILLLVILSLVVPAAALAAVSMPTKPDAIEFSLGGFIKMDLMWDSSTVNKNLSSKMYRTNDAYNGSHGRLRGMVTYSRLNFTIKGPKVFGALTTGFLEMDWDANGAAVPPAAGSGDSTDTGAFRLRHAMFRLTWPETELMLGQYWSFFSEFSPEVAADTAFQYRGSTSYRPAGIRLTQKFPGWGTAAFMVATPRQGTAREANDQGERAETPHLEGKLAFEQNIYGKAPYYGNPRGLVAQVVAGWQRTNVQALTANFANVARPTWGQQNYGAQLISNPEHQYLDHWSVMGILFIPVLTTQTAKLAGTASILTQWSVGEGQGFVTRTWRTDDAFMQYSETRLQGATNFNVYRRRLTPSFTGFVQAQYYATNEWFATFCWGFMRNYGIGMDRISPGGLFRSAMVDAAVPAGLGGQVAAAGNSDITKYSNQFNTTLWYQAVKAVKFGLSYVYTQDRYIQRATSPAYAPLAASATDNSTPFGQNHRVEFCGFFYF